MYVALLTDKEDFGEDNGRVVEANIKKESKNPNKRILYYSGVYTGGHGIRPSHFLFLSNRKAMSAIYRYYSQGWRVWQLKAFIYTARAIALRHEAFFIVSPSLNNNVG